MNKFIIIKIKIPINIIFIIAQLYQLIYKVYLL